MLGTTPNILHSECSSGGGGQAALRDRSCVPRLVVRRRPPFQVPWSVAWSKQL